MTKPMLLSEFTRLPPASRACPLDGLSAAIDLVAGAAPASHRFLRFQYYAAALALHGGAARTLLVEHDGDPVIALPFVRFGPAIARLATVPGVDAPFRGFPATSDAPAAAYDALIDALGNEVNALHIGPVAPNDIVFAALDAAARRRGWLAVDCAVSAALAPQTVERAGCDHEIFDGAALVAGGFERLATLAHDHALPFWRRAATDSVIAAMLSAEGAMRDGGAGAFALFLDIDGSRHHIAGHPALAQAQQNSPTRTWTLVKPGMPALVARTLAPWRRRNALARA